MKKIVCYALNAALALSLCACANSGGTINSSASEGSTPFVEVSDPFSGKNPAETESGGIDSEEDDGFNRYREMGFSEDFIDYEKHASSFISNNVQVKANGESYGDNAPVIYRGGEVEISFTATTEYVSAREFSTGYRVFIGGTPQILSLNGSEPSTMVILEGKKGDTKECSIRFTPRLTKEDIENKDNLTLTLHLINNPLYLAFGTVEHFEPPHHSGAKHRPFKLEGDCEIVELVSGKSFENFVHRDPEVSKYLSVSTSELKSKEPDGSGIHSGISVYFELCSTTKEKPVIRDGKADITLMLYGGESATAIPYKVYFYVNHEPVKIDGCDYITADLKYGFAAKYSMTLDNLKAGDFVYAIAIAENIRITEGISYDELTMKTETKRLFAAD